MDQIIDQITIKDLDQGSIIYDIDSSIIKLNKLQHWDLYWQHLYETHKLLCRAAQENDLNQLKILLSPKYHLPIDINMKLEEQWSCLHYAAMEGHIESCRLLLQHQAQPDITNVQQRTPLHIAAIKGYLEICQLLIQYRTSINLFDYQYNSPLHLASQNGNKEIIELLLDHGADYNIRNHFNLNAYDISIDQQTQEIFDKRGLYQDYQKRSFRGVHNRNDHIKNLLKLSDRLSTQISQTKISKIEIQQVGPQDFAVLTQLGKGSFGQVYLVQKKGNTNYYAMKILIKRKLQAAGIVKYIQTERKILTYVTSPFIVKLHYAFQTENKLYMILDYCPGGDLEQLMNERGKLPEKATKAYACEILLALETLHQNCIVYRDLKPSNVVIDKDGHALLTDFGLSKELNAQRATSFCGSYAYLAPEMLDKSGHGYPLDWYLFGVFIYELVHGNPPFYERDKNKMFNNIKTNEPPRPDNISDELWDLLKRLLEKNQSKRLGSKEDAEELKKHPWFINVNWQQVIQRKQPVPKATLRSENCDLDLKVTFSEQAQKSERSNFIHDWDY
ncbi:unnamed protein product [Paramecium pentaurelia]|uniref:Protein kinase domain-containing protein n=1 Tax=Paramecium pentaurelia TaxID=43138 RepID=A0A8S1URX3_9CILI|nr:unnamed protein product [Paramecium pentaurelia]